MHKKRKWTLISLATGVALILALAGVWLFGSTSVASAAERTVDDLQTITRSATGPGLLGEGYLGHGGWGRGGIRGIDYQKLLAEALGIGIEDLEAAYEAARTEAIGLAVQEGLITQEQADEMLVWGGIGHRGFGFLGFHRGPKGVSSDAIDEEALLAKALGIGVEALQAARETANQAAIAQAVEEGIITQEQADQMRARKDLQSYLDRNALLAKALGMEVADLESAYAEGKTLSDLMGERGLDAAAVRDKLQTALDEALAQAVEDGVITQEQADEIQTGRGWDLGFGMPFGPGGRGGFRGFPGHEGFEGFRGRGGFGGGRPCPPGTDTDTGDSDGAMFRRPQRFVQPGSAL